MYIISKKLSKNDLILSMFSYIIHMIWVHKRKVSGRRFFYTPKTYVIIDRY